MPTSQQPPSTYRPRATNDAPTLILQQKWEDLMAYVYPHILESLPRSERFVLGADIRKIMWDVETCLIEFSLRYGNRKDQLEFIDICAKKLMAMIRVAIALKIVPKSRHEQVSKRLSEIGKIVGGLKKVR